MSADTPEDRTESFAESLRWWSESELRLLAGNDDMAEAQQAACAELERRELERVK